eukprot:TRINITY_DN28035_c0_g1_i1.p1 TRINITY_DN28035_c0_g1~~TRINITY_DN28035_c0_g1_i1.p1  ORF type:complete len:691 (+),score=160.71 TRINITY_DN28035_c0_g1_i1:99-2171(+)
MGEATTTMPLATMPLAQPHTGQQQMAQQGGPHGAMVNQPSGYATGKIPLYGVRSVKEAGQKTQLSLRITAKGLELVTNKKRLKRCLNYQSMQGVKTTMDGRRAVFFGDVSRGHIIDVEWVPDANDDPPGPPDTFLTLVSDSTRIHANGKTLPRYMVPDNLSMKDMHALPPPDQPAMNVPSHIHPPPAGEDDPAQIKHVAFQRASEKESFGVRLDQDLQVLGVIPGTAAERAGIDAFKGGRVVGLNKNPVHSLRDLEEHVPLLSTQTEVSIAIRGASRSYFERDERDPVLFPVGGAEVSKSGDDVVDREPPMTDKTGGTPGVHRLTPPPNHLAAAAARTDSALGRSKDMPDCACISLNRRSVTGEMGIFVTEMGSNLIIIDIDRDSPAEYCGLANYIGHRILAVAPARTAQEKICGGTVSLFYSSAVPVRTKKELAQQLMGRYAVEVYVALKRHENDHGEEPPWLAKRKRTYSREAADGAGHRTFTKDDLGVGRLGAQDGRTRHHFEDQLVQELLDLQELHGGAPCVASYPPARSGYQSPPSFGAHAIRNNQPPSEWTPEARQAFTTRAEPSPEVLARDLEGLPSGAEERALARPLKFPILEAGLQKIDRTENMLVHQGDMLARINTRLDRVEMNTSRLLRAASQSSRPALHHSPTPYRSDPVDDWQRSYELGRQAACSCGHRLDDDLSDL